MTNYTVQTVDAFIAAAPAEARPHLQEIRAAVIAALPEAEEQIGYGKPYYKQQRWLVGFDFYKHHINFEIWEGQLPAKLRSALEAEGYQTGNKTFRIRYDQPVPADRIQELANAQLAVAEAKLNSKKA
jgi:uncharacterized protein YdhG (YjbR/CyaY superfamily)